MDRNNENTRYLVCVTQPCKKMFLLGLFDSYELALGHEMDAIYSFREEHADEIESYNISLPFVIEGHDDVEFIDVEVKEKGDETIYKYRYSISQEKYLDKVKEAIRPSEPEAEAK